MPTLKQMEKLAAAVGREPRRTPTPGPGDPMPPEYWESVLRDLLADASPVPPGPRTGRCGYRKFLSIF
jgi:hypothetical protein